MITIIIPCYNEEYTIHSVLIEVTYHFRNAQIIVVDNNSTDNSASIIKNIKSKYNNIEYYLCKSRGKSNAILSVINFIKFETIVLIDADLEYQTSSIAKLLKLHTDKNADMTIGIRHNKLTSSYFANLLIRHILKKRFGKSVSDVLTGARILSKELLSQCKAKGFGLETELTKLAVSQNLNIIEAKCQYTPRIRGKKIRPWHLFELMRIALC